MPQAQDDYDWLQSILPGWREEESGNGGRDNSSSGHLQAQSPHPAFADAMNTAQTSHAAFLRYRQPQSPHIQAAQMTQRPSSSMSYSQGMDETLFRSQLHRHPSHQPLRQQQLQQQHQPQPKNHHSQAQEQRPTYASNLYQDQSLAREQRARQSYHQSYQSQSQPQSHRRESQYSAPEAPREVAQPTPCFPQQQKAHKNAQLEPSQDTHPQTSHNQVPRQQPPQPQASQQAVLQQSPPPQDLQSPPQQQHLQVQHQTQQQMQRQSSQPPYLPLNQPRPMQQSQIEPQTNRQQEAKQYRHAQQSIGRISSPQGQHREVNQQQFVRPSDINPSMTYYQPKTTTRPDYERPQQQSSAPQQRPMSRIAVDGPQPQYAQSPAATQSDTLNVGSLPQVYDTRESHPRPQQSPAAAVSSNRKFSSASIAQTEARPQPALEMRESTTQPYPSPRAAAQPSPAPSEHSSPKRGSFLDDTNFYSTTSPQKDPYTSSSRSTLGPQSVLARISSTTASPTTSRTRPSALSTTAPSEGVTQVADNASKEHANSRCPSSHVSVSTSGGPMNSSTTSLPSPMLAPLVSNRSPAGALETSANVKSPAPESGSHTVPQAIRPYMTPQMMREYKSTPKPTTSIPNKSSGQMPGGITATSTSKGSVRSAPTSPVTSQTCGPTVKQTNTQVIPSADTPTGKNLPALHSKAAQQPRARSSSSFHQLPDMESSLPKSPALSVMSSSRAPTNRSVSSTSANVVQTSSTPASPAMPSTGSVQKDGESNQSKLRDPSSTSVTLAPPDNFTPFLTASNRPPVPAASHQQSNSGSSNPTKDRNSLFPSDVDSAGRPRQQGRSSKDPRLESPANRLVGIQRPVSRLGVQSQPGNNQISRTGQSERGLSAPSIPPRSNPSHALHPPAHTAATGHRPASTSTTPQSGAISVYHDIPSTRNPASLALAQFNYDGNPRPPAKRLHKFDIKHRPSPLTAYARGEVSASIQDLDHSSEVPAAKFRKLDDGSRDAGLVGPAGLIQPNTAVRRLPVVEAQYHSPYDPQNDARSQIPTQKDHRHAREAANRKYIRTFADIVEPLKATDALPKDAYDPQTIARDILIAAGRHPQEKSLNHHLDCLRRNFRAVDGYSDLTTFRWDLVDPHVDYPPSVIKGIDEAYEAARKAKLSSTKALDVLPQSGALQVNSHRPWPTGQDHIHGPARDGPTAPQARPVESCPTGSPVTSTVDVEANSNLNGRQTLTSSGAADLTTRVPTPTASWKSSLSRPQIHSHPPSASAPATANTVKSTSKSTSLNPPAIASAISLPLSTSKSPPKPPPTPPTAVNLNAFGALPFKAPSYYSPLRPTAQPLPYSLPLPPPPPPPSASSPPKPKASVSLDAPARDPVKVTAPVSKSSPSKLVGKAHEHTPSSQVATPQTPPKSIPHRSLSSRDPTTRQSPLPKDLPEPLVIIPASPRAMAPPKRGPGRPSKSEARIEVAIDNRPAPHYQVFKCRWIGCEAELHNLQAIQTHLVGVHIPHHIVCAWENCPDKKPRAAADMWEHVRAVHVRPLAWKLGDGPSVSVNAAESYDALQQITQGRQDTVTLPADRDSVKIFSRIHGTQTSKQKARLMEEGGRRWKEEAGPGADLSDRPLSTPPRLRASRHGETAYTLSDVRVVI